MLRARSPSTRATLEGRSDPDDFPSLSPRRSSVKALTDDERRLAAREDLEDFVAGHLLPMKAV